MKHGVMQWFVRLALMLTVSSSLAIGMLILESFGDPAYVPNRMPWFVLIGVLVLVLHWLCLERFNQTYLFRLGLGACFGLGMLLSSECWGASRCFLWGEGFRLQHTFLSALSLITLISMVVRIHYWGPDELVRLFQSIVVFAVTIVPLCLYLEGLPLDSPPQSTYVLAYAGLMLASIVAALSMYNITASSVDPRPTQALVHSLLPLGLLGTLGALAALLLSSDARLLLQNFAALIVLIFNSIVTLFALIIAFPLQLLIGDPMDYTKSATPVPVAPSGGAAYPTEGNLVVPPEAQSPPFIAYLASFMLLMIAAMGLFFILRAFMRFAFAQLNQAPETPDRESIWDWQDVRSELKDLLPTWGFATKPPEHLSAARKQIRSRYRKLLKLAHDRRLDRSPATTPRTFQARLEAEFNPEAVATLTQVYEQARYGPEPSASDVAAATSAFNELEHS